MNSSQSNSTPAAALPVGNRVLKFLLQIEFAPETRFLEGPPILEWRIKRAMADIVAAATAGPEPMVTVVKDA